MKNNNEIIRWGILSTARINHRVIPALRESKRSNLVAVSSRTKNKAAAFAKEWEIPLSFGSYQEMLDSGKIDAVYISLPNHLHAEWSIKAMMSGLHVLCEKPFALTLEDVDRMIETHKSTGRILAEAFMYRHHPQTRLAGEIVESGRLGEISMVRGTFDFSFTNRDNIRLIPEFGGGCLWDVGVYPMSFAQYIMGGPPDWVMGSQWIGPSGVDETFAGLMGYPGARFAQISAAFRTPFYTFVEVIGTFGRLYLSMPFIHVNKSSMTFFPIEGDSEIISVHEEYLYLGEIEDMNNAILDGATNYISLKETRDHIQTIRALYKSAKERSVVSLD